MNIYYNSSFNINLGILNYLHPFDGLKFQKVYEQIKGCPNINFVSPDNAMSLEQIQKFSNELMKRLFTAKRVILRSLEVPYIPLLPFSVIDKRILFPMRWAVSATLLASIDALNNGSICWNLSGGYHHASQASAQGFCIYNDIGIAYQSLLESGELSAEDKVLIIDIDAHHGNGNANWFYENQNVTLLDIYNADIYPTTYSTRKRVDVSIPLPQNTNGSDYLNQLESALNTLSTDFKLAFVVAGTDVLSIDPLGGLKLSVEECVKRDQMVYEFLKKAGIPSVFVGGGGYSKDSSKAIINSIKNIAQLSD